MVIETLTKTRILYFYLLFSLSLHMCVRVHVGVIHECGHTCYGACVEVRQQLLQVVSLPLFNPEKQTNNKKN